MADYVTHARLSPSGSKRWMACPGSVTLEAPFPDTSSTYADDGTAMHTVAAWCLTEGHHAHTRIEHQIPVHDGGEPPRYVTFTDEMAVMVQEYVDTVRALATGHTLQVEQRVDFSPFVGVADQFGTADAIIWNARDGELLLVDLKTGYRFVDAEENSQLLTYALGALKQIVEGVGSQAATPATTAPAEADGDAPAGDLAASTGSEGAVSGQLPEDQVPEAPAGEKGSDDELW